MLRRRKKPLRCRFHDEDAGVAWVLLKSSFILDIFYMPPYLHDTKRPFFSEACVCVFFLCVFWALPFFKNVAASEALPRLDDEEEIQDFTNCSLADFFESVKW